MSFSNFRKDNQFIKTYGYIYIPEGTDLNTYLVCGNYSCTSNSLAKTLTNCPIEEAFRLNIYNALGSDETLNNNTWSYLTQEITPLNNPTHKWMRTITNNPNSNSVNYSNWEQTVNADTSNNVSIGKITATSAQINGTATVTGATTINNSLTVSGTTKIGNILQMVDDGNYVSQVMRAYSSGTVYGCELCIGGNGNTFVGSGESHTALKNALGQSSGEEMYITSDNNVYIYTKCNTIANKIKAATFNTSGNLLLKGTVSTNQADLAEVYKSDCKLEIGQVAAISCNDGYDITLATYKTSQEKDFDDIIGIVSEKPALLMNTPDDDEFNYHSNTDLPDGQYAIARIGKVKAMVNGQCKKGDRLFLMDNGILSKQQTNLQKKICFANETKTSLETELIEVIM